MNAPKLIAIIAGIGLLAPGLSIAQCLQEPSPWMVRIGGHNVDPSGGKSHTAAGTVEVLSKIGLTFNVDYRVCHNIYIDLLAAAPYTHGIKINGQRVASTRHLPPTLSVQYHVDPDATVDPFVGVGVNRTFFFNESLPGANLQLSNTWGVAAQGGVDWHLTNRWLLGADIRYLQIQPRASVNGTPIGRVKINPIAYGLNVGYIF